MCDVAGKVIHNVRFPLLDLETLNQVEEENKKKGYIPVSVNSVEKFTFCRATD